MPLKIVHLTSVHGPRDVRIFEKECVSLAARGYDVSLVVPTDRTEEVVCGVKIIAVENAPGRMLRVLLTGTRVFQAAMSLKPNICHIHDPELLMWIPLMRMAGVHVIYDMHENTSKSILDKPWIPLRARKCVARIYRVIERLLAHGVTVIFAENSYVKDFPWVRKGEVVLNMPIADHLLSIEATRSPEPTIVYLGAISGDRGGFATIKVLHLLKERGVQVKWLCIGTLDAADRGEMERLIALHSLEDRVKLCGYIEPRRAWQMISGCCCGLATLMPQPNYVESYPTKMFEYMALGIPVVASNFPLYREVVEGAVCGICVNPEDPSDIADAIQKLLCDPDAASRMGANGRRAVRERYNWGAQEVNLMNVYEGIEAHVRDHRRR